MYKSNRMFILILVMTCIFAVSCKAAGNQVKDERTITDTNGLESSERADRPDTAKDISPTTEEVPITDLGNFKGLYSSELESQANLILMVSNQSYYMDKVNLSIYIVKKLLVEQTYLVENQHNYLFYYLAIEEGKHSISVGYEGEIIGEGTIEIVNEKSAWVSLGFWMEKDTAGHIDFYTSDKPILIK